MFVIDGDLVAGLPAAHRAPDGQMRTGLSAMTDDELAGIGIYPATVVKPAVSGTQYYGAPTVEISDGRATVTYPVLDYSAAEVAGMLEAAKSEKKAEIAAARWAEMSEPAVVTGYSDPFYTDKESIGDMLSACDDMKNAIAAGHAQATDVTEWKTAVGTFVPVTLGDLVTIRLLLAQRKRTLYAKESALTVQINAATTIAEVAAISWSQP